MTGHQDLYNPNRLQFVQPNIDNVIEGYEQGDSPPFEEGPSAELKRKKKVTISVEMNDILPSQRDRSIERDGPESSHAHLMNDGKPLKSVYQDDPSEEQKQEGIEEGTPEKERQLADLAALDK